MMKKTKRNSIVIATALTTLLSAAAVFANTTSSNTVQAPKYCQTTQSFETNGSFKSHLNSLVTSGTLNQTQEDAIKSSDQKDRSVKGELNRHHKGEFNRGHHKSKMNRL